jgi:hypothetical protein
MGQRYEVRCTWHDHERGSAGQPVDLEMPLDRADAVLGRREDGAGNGGSAEARSFVDAGRLELELSPQSGRVDCVGQRQGPDGQVRRWLRSDEEREQLRL